MFSKACLTIREATYGVLGTSKIGANQLNITNGTAFMIAPGVLATAAHFVHINSDIKKPVHSIFEAIRAPDIKQKMESAQFIAEDPITDIALLRIKQPHSKTSVNLQKNRVSTGANCGSLGFPLANVALSKTGKAFNLIERFQGAYISAFVNRAPPTSQPLYYYETDSLMYGGSSGCPGFLIDGTVFGMHVKCRIEKPKGKVASSNQGVQLSTRLAIALWVSSMDIISFARTQGIRV